MTLRMWAAIFTLFFQCEQAWAQGACAPPAGASWFMVDATDIPVRGFHEETEDIYSGYYRTPSYPIHVEPRDGNWILHISVMESILIKPQQLWKFRFFEGNDIDLRTKSILPPEINILFGLSDRGDDDPWPNELNYPANTDMGVLPCTAAERKARAEALFAQGFEQYKLKNFGTARKLFLAGLHIDNKNPTATFYFAQALWSYGIEREKFGPAVLLFFYKRARLLGLDSQTDAVAMAQVLRLQVVAQNRRVCYSQC